MGEGILHLGTNSSLRTNMAGKNIQSKIRGCQRCIKNLMGKVPIHLMVNILVIRCIGVQNFARFLIS